MKKLIQLPIILIFVSAMNYSQVSQQWVNTESYSSGRFIVYNTTGFVTISGSVTLMDSPPSTKVVKYNVSGSQSWIRECVGNNCGLSIDRVHNTYVASYTYATWGEPKQMNLIKFNQLGVEQWRVIDTSFWYPDALVSMKGDYFGNSYLLMYRNFNYEVSKYDSTGSKIWVRIFNAPGSSDNQPIDFAIDRVGNIVVIGQSFIGSNTTFNLVKYSSSGVQQWVAQFTPPAIANQFSTNIALDTSGDILVTIALRAQGIYSDLTTIKYHPTGVQQWIRHFNLGNSYPDIIKTVIDQSGSVITAILYTGIIKYDSSGIQQWVKNIPSTAISVDKNLNIYFTKTVNNSTYTLYKCDASGVDKWQISYSPGNNSNYIGMNGIILDTVSNVYVTGSYSYLSYPYIWVPVSLTVKYSQLTGISKVGEKIPVYYHLSQNYPNPFNPITKIKFQIPPSKGARGMIQLIIYDILGREIAVLVNEQLSPGTYEVEWDGSNSPSGVYFYKLITSDYTETKRMVLVK